MPQISLVNIFQNYTNGKKIFKEKDILTIKFTPNNIPHREKQIEQIALILAPALRNEKPSNVFIYGKTGTGKSLCTNHVIEKLLEAAKQNNGSAEKIKTIYINCKMRKVSDTEYRLLSQLLLNFGEEVPYTGLPTDKLYQKFYQLIDMKEQIVILVLDEIDALVNKIGDNILYNLTRINQELKNSKLTIIGISNNVSFIENLDPRVKSSLSEEEVIFPPYNANELKDILKERVMLAFYPEAISEGVIAKCAALAAQEHGDARKALDLLRVAGEIAERRGFAVITEEHVDEAESRLDTDKTLEIIKTQPKHSQAVFLAILNQHKNGLKHIQTGDIFDQYAQICKKNGLKQLTQRRVSDLISELDMLGLVNAKVISKGRYGRTREISLNLSKKLIEKIEDFLSREFV